MPYTYKLAFVLEPTMVGSTFSRWPFHMTVLPWFDAEGRDSVVHEIIERYIEGLGPINTTIGENEDFGAEGHIPACLVEKTSDIQTLHDNLFNTVRDAGMTFKNPEHCGGDSYRPHITHQRGKKGYIKGDQVILSSLELIKLITEPNGWRSKQVIKKWQLS